MEIVHGLENWKPGGRPVVVALGNFDGLHLGHQEVIARAVERARTSGAQPTVVSFHPHPRQVLDPCRAPRLLTTLREKVNLVSQMGVERFLLVRFTPAFRNLSAADFVQRVLVEQLGAREVFVGYDHQFGADGSGTSQFLQALGERLGIQTWVVPPVELDGAPVSSTRIRRLLQNGEMAGAARLLGRWPRLEGVVTPGAGRGSGLGFPTANIYLPPGLVMPAAGVYLVRVQVNGEFCPGLSNLGRVPTFGAGEARAETHMLNFQGWLYGSCARVEFFEFIRPENTFPNARELQRQVRRDLAYVREQWQQGWPWEKQEQA